MRRPTSEEGDGFGSDSFLDIVANIVGILIILVTVVGLRVQHSPALAKSTTDIQSPDLSPLLAQIDALRNEVDQAQRQLTERDLDEEQKRQAADALAAQLANSELDLAEQRNAMLRKADVVDSLEADIAARRAAAQQLQDEVDKTRPAEQEVVQIESYPTPVSKSVDGQEAHFQLLGDRLVYVPMEELLDRMKQDGRQLLREDRMSPVLSATVGPTGGFRLHYTMKPRRGRFCPPGIVCPHPRGAEPGRPDRSGTTGTIHVSPGTQPIRS